MSSHHFVGNGFLSARLESAAKDPEHLLRLVAGLAPGCFLSRRWVSPFSTMGDPGGFFKARHCWLAEWSAAAAGLVLSLFGIARSRKGSPILRMRRERLLATRAIGPRPPLVLIRAVALLVPLILAWVPWHSDYHRI